MSFLEDFTGSIDETLQDLQGKVRSDPSDAKLRIYLFQLYAVRGEWERSLTQLNVVADLDVSALAMVQTYREALKCEALRKEVMSGRRTPVLFGEPAEWVAYLFEALRLTTQGRHAESQAQREQALVCLDTAWHHSTA